MKTMMKMMKTTFVSSVAALLISGAATAADYVIDTKGAHASVNFKASHLGYSYIVGRFNDFEGTFHYDENDPTTASIAVTIDAASLDTNHAERDRHLRSDDFFAVETYPTVTFNSTAFEEGADGVITVTGDLSLHGVTQSVQLGGRHIGHGEDPWGGYRRGFEASVTIDAAAFGFSNRVGEVEILVIVEGVRQ